MKSELRVVPHLTLPGQNVVEVWHGGKLVGTVTGADGAGVRVISKHRMESWDGRSRTRTPVYDTLGINCFEVKMLTE